MTKKEAYKILSNGLANAPSEHEWCMAFEMAIEALGQTMWIPVSQKLPDKYGIYLVTLNNHDTDFCEFYPNDRTFGMNGNVCYEVTAWQPLPKPYNAEGESDIQ